MNGMNLKEKFESILNDTSTVGAVSSAYSSNKTNSTNTKSGSLNKVVQISILVIVIAFLCGIIYFKECNSSKIEEMLQEKLQLQEKLNNSKEEDQKKNEINLESEEENEEDPLFQRF